MSETLQIVLGVFLGVLVVVGWAWLDGYLTGWGVDGRKGNGFAYYYSDEFTDRLSDAVHQGRLSVPRYENRHQFVDGDELVDLEYADTDNLLREYEL